MKPGRKAYEDSLGQTYRRLINQLDQKVGREKRILQKYTRALEQFTNELSHEAPS